MTFIRKKTVQSERHRTLTRTSYICKCDTCGKEFERKQNKSKKHYCSDKCYFESLKRGYEQICANPSCNKVYYHRLSPPSKYCCRQCYHEDRYLGAICNHNECDTPVSKLSKSGYCKKHRGFADYQKHKAILYKELGDKCACCGERDLMFLTVDHVNNDGGKLRKQKSAHARPHLMLKLHRENPGSLQLLCMNCNHAKMRNDGELYRPEKFTRRSNQTERKVAA